MSKGWKISQKIIQGLEPLFHRKKFIGPFSAPNARSAVGVPEVTGRAAGQSPKNCGKILTGAEPQIEGNVGNGGAGFEQHAFCFLNADSGQVVDGAEPCFTQKVAAELSRLQPRRAGGIFHSYLIADLLMHPVNCSLDPQGIALTRWLVCAW